MIKTPFEYLCGMQCAVGAQRCPAFDTCPVNKNLVKGIINRYANCCRRSLRYTTTMDLNFPDVESLVRWNMSTGFRCPTCGTTMTINIGQTVIEADGASVYSIDHVKPLSKGGTNAIDNLIICCRQCNKAKGDLDNGDSI
jgi:5-methylcytosine-specific restriction endonuclease McrA